MGTGECNAGENLAMNKFPLEGGGGEGLGIVDASSYRNQDKLWADEPPRSLADFTYPPYEVGLNTVF